VDVFLFEVKNSLRHSRKARAIGLIGLVVFFGLATADLDAVDAASDKTMSLLAQADLLRAQSRHQEALDAYTRVLDEDPDNVAAFFYRAEVATKLNLNWAAVADYRKVLVLLGQLPSAPQVYDPSGRETLEKRGVTVDEIWRRLGNVQKRLGDSESAVEDFTEAINYNPDDAESYRGRGEAYGNLGYHQKALDDLNKAIELDEALVEVYWHRAFIYYNLEDLNRAMADLDRFIAADRSDGETRSTRAYMRYLTGDYEGALADYTGVIQEGPADAHAYANRALVHRKLGHRVAYLADQVAALCIQCFGVAPSSGTTVLVLLVIVGLLMGAAAVVWMVYRSRVRHDAGR